MLLNAFAESVQGLTREVEFAGEFRGGYALGEAAEQEENRRGPFVGPLEHRAGEGVEHAPAAGMLGVRMTAIAKNRSAVATVNPKRVG